MVSRAKKEFQDYVCIFCHTSALNEMNLEISLKNLRTTHILAFKDLELSIMGSLKEENKLAIIRGRASRPNSGTKT